MMQNELKSRDDKDGDDAVQDGEDINDSDDDLLDGDIPKESLTSRAVAASLRKDQRIVIGSQVLNQEPDFSVIDEEDDQNFITIRSLIDEGKASPLKVSDAKINIFAVKSEINSLNGDEKQTGIS